MFSYETWANIVARSSDICSNAIKLEQHVACDALVPPGCFAPLGLAVRGFTAALHDKREICNHPKRTARNYSCADTMLTNCHPSPLKQKKTLMVFGHMKLVDMTISRFWDFRQNLELLSLRSFFLSKRHIWTVQVLFSDKKFTHGSCRPHISGRRSIYGPSVHIFLLGGPYIAVPCASEFILWLSELILWVPELIPLDFGCLNLHSGWMNLHFGRLNLYFGCRNWYRCTLGVSMYTLGEWTCTLGVRDYTLGEGAYTLDVWTYSLGPCQ